MSATSVARAPASAQPIRPEAHAAAGVWLARRSRAAHPAGSFDRARRWSPASDEEQPCCRAIRSPSRAWPYALLTHCRSRQHVAALYGVDVRELRRAIRASDVGQIRAASSEAVARDAAAPAMIAPDRWAEYNRKFNALLMRGESPA